MIKETAKKNDTNYFFVVMVSEELKDSIEVIIVATGIKELQHFGWEISKFLSSKVFLIT